METYVCLSKASSTFNTVSFLTSNLLLGLPNLLLDRTNNRLKCEQYTEMFGTVGIPKLIRVK